MQNPTRTAIAVGLRVPDAFGLAPLTCAAILARCVTLGVGSVELSAGVVEAFLGAPMPPAALQPSGDGFETGLLPIEEEVIAEAWVLGHRAFAAHVRAWRLAVSLAPLDALRRQYAAAGVRIEILNWPQLAGLADDEVDYGFAVARALGANTISTDLSSGGPQRLVPVAAAHQLRVGFYGDALTTPADLLAASSAGAFTGCVVDLGHWAVGGHGSPLPFLAEHAERITHVHLCDRRVSDGAKTWFGEGDGHIREVLQTMRDRAWMFPAIVGIEYDLASDADQMTEVARALECCRSYLTGEPT